MLAWGYSRRSSVDNAGLGYAIRIIANSPILIVVAHWEGNLQRSLVCLFHYLLTLIINELQAYALLLRNSVLGCSIQPVNIGLE